MYRVIGLRVHVRAQPGGEFSFVETAFGKAEHLHVLGFLAGIELDIIQGKEDPVTDMGSTFVAIHEGKISCQAEGKAGRQIGMIG